MKSILNKRLQESKPKQFILLNENCQVFCGLKRGYPAFSDDIDDAKLLENDEQMKNVQYGTSFKLVKEYL